MNQFLIIIMMMAMNTLKLQKAVGKNTSQFNNANREMTLYVYVKSDGNENDDQW